MRTYNAVRVCCVHLAHSARKGCVLHWNDGVAVAVQFWYAPIYGVPVVILVLDARV